jgi:hypothetical protein
VGPGDEVPHSRTAAALRVQSGETANLTESGVPSFVPLMFDLLNPRAIEVASRFDLRVDWC